jgi:hypothetical protein
MLSKDCFINILSVLVKKLAKRFNLSDLKPDEVFLKIK